MGEVEKAHESFVEVMEDVVDEVADPKQFLTQKCDKVHHPECWDLNMPGLVSYAEVLYASEYEEDAEEDEDEDEDEDESGSRSDLQAKGKEVIGMLENPATTPSDLLLLRKELELLEKEN